MKKHLYKWLLPKLLKRACGDSIPGPREIDESTNCYFVTFELENHYYFVATGCENEDLIGKQYLNIGVIFHPKDFSIQFSEILNRKILIQHFYGLSEINFHTIYACAFHYITHFCYFRPKIARIFALVGQYIFNRKKLVTKSRMELLNFLLEDQIAREHDGIKIIDLMTKLYSIKWVLHPSRSDQQNKLEIFLKSLVESGDLNEINHEYVVTSKAVSTIEQYEGEERRHLGILKLQRRMVFLTIILVLVGLLQAGLVKLPTLIDLTTKKKHNHPIHTDGNYAALHSRR